MDKHSIAITNELTVSCEQYIHLKPWDHWFKTARKQAAKGRLHEAIAAASVHLELSNQDPATIMIMVPMLDLAEDLYRERKRK